MSPPESSPLSIACLLCGEETPRALHFMLPMLKTYLKREWRVENDAPERAALRIVNLDHPEGEALLASFGPGWREVKSPAVDVNGRPLPAVYPKQRPDAGAESATESDTTEAPEATTKAQKEARK